jgi:hypothetical protein
VIRVPMRDPSRATCAVVHTLSRTSPNSCHGFNKSEQWSMGECQPGRTCPPVHHLKVDIQVITDIFVNLKSRHEEKR